MRLAGTRQGSALPEAESLTKVLSDSWVQGSQTNQSTLKTAGQKQEFHGEKDSCESRAALSPGVSKRVATEADLDSDLALAPACCGISGKCSVYFVFLELQPSPLENGTLPTASLTASAVCRNGRWLKGKSWSLGGAQGGSRRKRECTVWGVGAEVALELGAMRWVRGLLLTAGSVALGPLLPCRPGPGHSIGELSGVLGQTHPWGEDLRGGQGPLPPHLQPSGQGSGITVSGKSDWALSSFDGSPGEEASLSGGSWGQGQRACVPGRDRKETRCLLRGGPY